MNTKKTPGRKPSPFQIADDGLTVTENGQPVHIAVSKAEATAYCQLCRSLGRAIPVYSANEVSA